MDPKDVEFDIKLYGQRCNAAHNGVDQAVKTRRFGHLAKLGAQALKNMHNILPEDQLPNKDMYDGIVKRFLRQYFTSVKIVEDPAKVAGWDVAYELLPRWGPRADIGIELLDEPAPKKPYKERKAEKQAGKTGRREASRSSQALTGEESNKMLEEGSLY